jgi:hypothetical protein
MHAPAASAFRRKLLRERLVGSVVMWDSGGLVAAFLQ